MNPDVLMLDRVGGSYTAATLVVGGLGGSEIEVLQVARGLTAKGYSVVVANGVDHVSVEDGVTYVPHAHAWQHVPTKALYLQRFSTPETKLEIPAGVRVVVRANDVYCPPYDVHRALLESGRAGLVANTQWQAAGFGFAKEKTIIPPMLEPMPKVKKQRGLFVFASGAMKGFEATAKLWCEMKDRNPSMRDAELLLVPPGWGEPRSLTARETANQIRQIGLATPEKYRYWIARAEGLFMVSTMPETFCCAAALAERAGTRTHILCEAGLSGLYEAVTDRRHITESADEFEANFLAALAEPLAKPSKTLRNLTPAHVMDEWTDVLQLDHTPAVLPSPFPDDPTLTANQAPIGPFFGDFLSELRRAIAPGGSEFGVGLTLFSLAASIQAKSIVEIGRFKGFSTLALAAACKLQDTGWTEPAAARQRPDQDYAALAGKTIVVSIDPAPRPEAQTLLTRLGLSSYVQCHDVRSDAYTPTQPIDLLFIDGGHSAADVRSDLQRFVPWVRPGGYFILHDYFGWFQPDGTNGSPIAAVIADELTSCDRVLIDTHYASLVIFRKATNLTERWELEPKPNQMPPRADGRPTVGLCLIAKGDEASTVATRAIASAKKAGVDCVTVVCDAQDATADVARSLGVDVFIRPSPAIDWARGFGVIAGARNEALAIAERRTDYVLMVDADDYYDGTLPATLDRDVYEVTITDGHLSYQRLQLFRSSLGLRYHGIIHETLQLPGGAVGRLEGLTYRRGKSSYAYQDQDPPQVKYAKHAQLATKWLLDHPDDARMQFYLARSYQDAGQLEPAVREYERRITMLNGWEEERSYSAYQIGLIRLQQGQDPTLPLLHAAAIGVPKAEPFVALARWYRDDARRQFVLADLFARKAAEIPQPVSALFTTPTTYQFEALAEVAICAYWLGNKHDALARFEALLPKVPADRRAWCEQQIAICRMDLSR